MGDLWVSFLHILLGLVSFVGIVFTVGSGLVLLVTKRTGSKRRRW